MSTATHTPGPWVLNPSETLIISEALDCVDNIICEPPPRHYASCQRWPANARLIAAAPDLLAAAKLQEAAETFHLSCDACEGNEIPELCEACFPHYDDARVARRNAIAKATVTDPQSERKS